MNGKDTNQTANVKADLHMLQKVSHGEVHLNNILCTCVIYCYAFKLLLLIMYKA